MKVGIITFHFPFNYGAVLQCYALSRKLELLGNEPQVINYCPWYHQNRYASYKNPFYYANRQLHAPAKNVFVRVHNGVKGFRDTVRSWKDAKPKLIREETFDAFRKANLRETRTYRSLRALRLSPPKCDLYIAGSDQLWNSKLTDNRFDPAYFLQFGRKKTKRATYAVGSYFQDPQAAKAEIAPMLRKLDAISLREIKFLPDVREASMGAVPIHIDVDPTLLLPPEAYEALMPKELPERDPFILVYTMPGPAQKQVNEAAKKLAAKTELKLIDINGNPNAENRKIEDQRICSPGEFLWYFKNAAFIVTNSFHGTVFSVLFRKRFAVILHKETGNRASELLDKLGLSHRYTDQTNDVMRILGLASDWNAAHAAIAKLRAESERYLRFLCGGDERPAFQTGRDAESPSKAGPKQPEEPEKPPILPPRERWTRIHSTEQKGTTMYTDDKNAQIVIALLKKYNVKKIVVSPGTTNAPIARAAQTDPFFEAYSAVDERGAAYLAGGLAFATGEPVALSCTGATASRDYVPGLTEAYYRGLPVIAITSQHHSPCYSDLMPQMTDRTVSQNDIKRFAAVLPLIKDAEDWRACVQLVNEALYTATRRDAGPVHINLPVGNLYSFTTKTLPDVQKIDVYDAETFPKEALMSALTGKRVALFIGAHKPFDAETKAAIEAFAEKFDAPVFCDHTANYTGKNRVQSEVACDFHMLKTMPELLIDLGSVSGDYSAGPIFKGTRVWRISEDRKFHNRHGAEIVEKLFFCSERFFFTALSDLEGDTKYYETVKSEVQNTKVPMLPLSNLYVASKLSKQMPKNSWLHLGILNSLRSMNYFTLDPSVTVSSNVGGFGIDGAVSTAFGQSLADENRLSFALIGDLAFFYDMNALGNRHIGNNLRILLINNARGVEFRLNTSFEKLWGAESDDLIAAHGHFGSAKAWAESMDFAYMTASDKEAFDAQIDTFCDTDPEKFRKPVLFEVFIDAEDEKTALSNLRAYNRPIG
ncbi:MAG: polysaccharide pyruvyl transferase family protein [Clostridia bacterium]|nr:polysaccharide pyruvyl transferase family protein [Clostridia bacterium]